MGAKILKFKFVNEKLSFGLFEFGPRTTQTLCLCGPSGPYVERCRPGLIYKTTSLFFIKKKNTKGDYLGVNIQFFISIVIK